MQNDDFSAEQIELAWQTAQEIDGYDPNDIRVVQCDNSGSIIKRTEFLGSRDNAWEIDQQGRARGKGYKLRDAIRAERQAFETTKQKDEEAAKKGRKQSAAQQAREAEMPNAVSLFERLILLEETVRRQQIEIDALKER